MEEWLSGMPTEALGGINPVGIAFTLLMGIVFILSPRRYAFLPVVFLTCYMTMGDAVVIAGCHFTMIRIFILFGWARLVIRREVRILKLNSIDRVILWWTCASFVTYVLLWRDFDAIIYELGQSYNTIGFYFLFRFLVRDLDDIVRIFKITALSIVPLAVSMVLEKRSGMNPFAAFGGVPAVTLVRDGVLRCQGPFAHPILAGTFGATLLPFFVALWRRGFRNKLLSFIGIASSALITVTSGSSGPVLTSLAALVALCLWPIRKQMRVLRWGIVCGIGTLAIFMKAPIWFVLARIDIFSGSTGYHRAYLIDRALANLSDWWLVGTKSTVLWADPDQHLFDVTNQYLVLGSRGGVITMMLFIWIIVRCFRAVGLSLRAAELRESRYRQFTVWALGAALFAHTITYLSVSYFDQNIVNWYLLLAMISSVNGSLVTAPRRSRATTAEPYTGVEVSSQSRFAT